MKLSFYWMARHEEYNHEFFGGILAPIPVYVAPLKGLNGYYVDPDPSQLKIAHIVLDSSLSHYSKGNILLHEMCHQATPDTHYHHHNSEWKEWMRRCGFKGKITSTTGLRKWNWR
jgi:predicted SprT family Zn-dependent metalloprotease